MKKNYVIAILVAAFMMLMSSYVQKASNWVCVTDACGSCKFNDNDNYCGKCGKDGLYRASSKAIGGGWVKHEMKCKYCPHTCVWKEK